MRNCSSPSMMTYTSIGPATRLVTSRWAKGTDCAARFIRTRRPTIGSITPPHQVHRLPYLRRFACHDLTREGEDLHQKIIATISNGQQTLADLTLPTTSAKCLTGRTNNNSFSLLYNQYKSTTSRLMRPEFFYIYLISFTLLEPAHLNSKFSRLFVVKPIVQPRANMSRILTRLAFYVIPTIERTIARSYTHTIKFTPLSHSAFGLQR